jgi:hypothetical protein
VKKARLWRRKRSADTDDHWHFPSELARGYDRILHGQFRFDAINPMASSSRKAIVPVAS